MHWQTGSIILKTNDGGETWDEKVIQEFTNMYDLQIINDSSAYFLAGKDNINDPLLCTTTDTLNSWSIVSQNIESFYCLDDMTIFADANDTLMKSIDGGLSWEKKQYIGEGGTIHFRSNDVGFIFGERAILKSSDSGENWKIQKMNYPAINDVYFFDKNLGFACLGWPVGCHGGGCFYDGYLISTNDGGKTWKYNIGGAMISSCFFADEMTGFIVRSQWSGNSSTYKTNDGGKNWTNVYERNSGMTDFRFWGNDISFLNQTIGWAAGRYKTGDSDTTGAALLGTSDGGENWDLVWKFPNTDVSDYQLNSIHAVNTTAWAVGESGLILKYTEQNQWQVLPSITDLPLNDVFFSDEQHGWIAGGYFNEDDVYLKLFKTKDGGENWQQMTDIDYQINDMFFEDSPHGWAVGNDTTFAFWHWFTMCHGIILETEDGGNHWNIIVKDLSASLTAIHFKDGYGWAVGGNGLVLRTEDGATWVNHNTGITYPNKFSLYQNYPNPFNPSTKIKYSLPKPETVTIEVYNIIGQKIETLLNKPMPAGYHEVEFNGQNLSSGVYLYRIEAGEWQDVKKMILIK